MSSAIDAPVPNSPRDEGRATPAPRILLGQLGAYGDCLFATAIARQIKQDYPNCVLIWAIGSMYRQILDGNPYVDEIYEFPLASRGDVDKAWMRFEAEVRAKRKRGEYDQLYLTQIGPNNYQNFDGTIRASIFRGYPKPIMVPIAPVLRLHDSEIENVYRFVQQQGIAHRKYVVLFECSSTSQQTFVTPQYALEVALLLLQRISDCTIILSSNVRFPSPDERIIDGSVLTLRENAELTKYCSLLVGCSSGVSWVCTSDWAKPLPIIQLLRRSTSVFASMCHDAEYFGLPTNHIIEMTDCSSQKLADCIHEALTGTFEAARHEFHEQIPVELNFYLEVFMRSLLRRGQIVKAIQSIFHVARRYGWQPFAKYLLSKQPLTYFSHTFAGNRA